MSFTIKNQQLNFGFYRSCSNEPFNISVFVDFGIQIYSIIQLLDIIRANPCMSSFSGILMSEITCFYDFDHFLNRKKPENKGFSRSASRIKNI